MLQIQRKNNFHLHLKNVLQINLINIKLFLRDFLTNLQLKYKILLTIQEFHERDRKRSRDFIILNEAVNQRSLFVGQQIPEALWQWRQRDAKLTKSVFVHDEVAGCWYWSHDEVRLKRLPRLQKQQKQLTIKYSETVLIYMYWGYSHQNFYFLCKMVNDDGESDDASDAPTACHHSEAKDKEVVTSFNC